MRKNLTDCYLNKNAKTEMNKLSTFFKISLHNSFDLSYNFYNAVIIRNL